MAAKKNPERTMKEIALRAIELNRLIVEATKELEGLKAILREDAKEQPWREYPTRKGSIRAAFVAPTMWPRKDGKDKLVSLDPVLDLMGHYSFDEGPLFQLFEEVSTAKLKVTEPAAFQAGVSMLHREERDIVLSLIEERPGYARLTLPGKK